jgi:hypothetical protein
VTSGVTEGSPGTNLWHRGWTASSSSAPPCRHGARCCASRAHTSASPGRPCLRRSRQRASAQLAKFTNEGRRFERAVEPRLRLPRNGSKGGLQRIGRGLYLNGAA